MATKKSTKKATTKKSKWDLIEEIRADIIKFAEDYWDNGGLYNDGDIDDIIAKVESISKMK